jgi:hypothetical protein
MITSKHFETDKDVYNDILSNLYNRLARNTAAIDKMNRLNYTRSKYNYEETSDIVKSDVEMYELESEALKSAITRIGYLANYKTIKKKIRQGKL